MASIMGNGAAGSRTAIRACKALRCPLRRKQPPRCPGRSRPETATATHSLDQIRHGSSLPRNPCTSRGKPASLVKLLCLHAAGSFVIMIAWPHPKSIAPRCHPPGGAARPARPLHCGRLSWPACTPALSRGSALSSPNTASTSPATTSKTSIGTSTPRQTNTISKSSRPKPTSPAIW